jgi:hypothetical protein
MNALTAGLKTIANGVLSTLGALGTPVAIALILCGGSLLWLAMVEIHELDRLGTKPRVITH